MGWVLRVYFLPAPGRNSLEANIGPLGSWRPRVAAAICKS